MLKFFPKILVSTMPFPLLKGVRGMLKWILSKNIPLSPFKGGKISCKSSNLAINFNIWKFAKLELNNLPLWKRQWERFQSFACLLLFLFLRIGLWAQEAPVQPVETRFKELVHPDATVKNTFHINSKKLEFSPTYYQNGLVYVLTDKARKTIDGNIGVPFFELFYATLDGEGMPSNPQPFSTTLNSSKHEGPLSFNFTEDIIYYTTNSNQKNTQGKFTMNLYEARRGNEDWENNTPLPFNNPEYHTMHPSLAANGTKLYFASNRPGGYGGTDIYYVEDFGSGWGDPVNMGPIVNTNKNEAFPFIHETGMLFFASEGQGGLGGYDIFAINTYAKEMNEIIHLGEPFNSPNADFGLILNPTGTQGYFTSSRLGGMGQDDIYQFDAPNGLFANTAVGSDVATITIVGEKSGQIIPDAGVYIFEKNASGLFGEEDFYEVVLEPKADNPDQMEVRFVLKKDLGAPELYTNDQGLVAAEMKTDQEYLILVTKEGYANKEMQFSTVGQPFPINIEIPLATNSCATLTGIVLDEKNGTGIADALVSIQSDCDGSMQTLTADAAGNYTFCLPLGCNYTVSAAKTGFNTSVVKVSTQNLAQSAVKRNIILSPIDLPLAISTERLEEGSTIVLENIYYDFNKSTIRTGAAEELDALVTIMNQYPSMEVELTAHTDARGDAAYNRKLSRERAAAAKAYLVNKGINSARIRSKGMGEVAIRNHCTNGVKCSDEEHQYNRRTEVRVTKLLENVGVEYSGK